MELWRPDWSEVYGRGNDRLPDVDGELLCVTRETLRLARSALRRVMAEEYYHNSGAAEHEIAAVLGPEPSQAPGPRHTPQVMDPEPARRTLGHRLARVRCWLRGYHCNSPNIGRFRYDVDGVCCYCGVVGTGIEEDGE